MRRAWHSASTRDCVELQVGCWGSGRARSALPYRVTLGLGACPLPGVHELEHARPLGGVEQLEQREYAAVRLELGRARRRARGCWAGAWVPGWAGGGAGREAGRAGREPMGVISCG